MKDEKSILEQAVRARYRQKQEREIRRRNKNFKETADIFNKWLQNKIDTKFETGDLALLNNSVVYIVEVQPKGYITQPRCIDSVTGETRTNIVRKQDVYFYKHLGKNYSSSTTYSDGQTSETYLEELSNEL